MPMPTRAGTAVLFVVLATLSGCGADAVTRATNDRPDREYAVASTSERDQSVDLMRSTVSFRFKPFATPDELLENVDVAAEGTISKVTGSVSELGGDTFGFVHITVEPMQAWKASGPDKGTFEFVIQRPNNADIDQYAEGLLEEHIFFLGYWRDPVVLALRSDQQVLEAAPQGLLFVNPDGVLESVWGDVEVENTSSGFPEIVTASDLRESLDRSGR